MEKQGAGSYIERGFGSLLDPAPFRENLSEITENQFKISRKVGLKPVSVIFQFALFWIFFKSDISQNDPKILESDPLMGDLW